MIKNTHTKLGDHLLMCDGIVAHNGDIVKVTASDKLILAFMHHRWDYFVVNSNNEAYDTQEYIALRTGSSVKTVERCILKFHKAGILLAEKRFNTKTKHNKWFWLGFNVKNYVIMDGDVVKEVIKDKMDEYKPKPHYNHDKVVEVVNTGVVDIPDEQEYFSSRCYSNPEDSLEWMSYDLEVVGDIPTRSFVNSDLDNCPF